MHAVELRARGGPLVVTERPRPTPSGRAVVIDVTACGVCRSDLHVVDGDYPAPLPIVLGHEITGIENDLGPVMVYAPRGCGRCTMCASGQEMLCPDGRETGLVVDGGYAEAVLVAGPEYLVALGALDPVRAAPLACGGLTAYRAVVRGLAEVRRPGARALVIGAGGLGQFAIQFLRLRSDAEVVAVDADAAKRARARELGAHEAVAPDDLDTEAAFVVDFVGANPTVALAARAVARQGLVVVVGLAGGRAPFGFGAVPHEARFTTSVWGTRAQLGELLALATKEPLHYTVEPVPLVDAQQAHDRLRAGEVAGRLVLVP
jgi:propanol-preferring alcohol dehydrogenase